MTKNRSKARYLICTLGAFAILVAVAWGVYIGRDIPFSEQQPLYSMLQTVSGIMFSVFGLWIALLYPDLRRRVFSVDRKQIEESHESRATIHPKDELEQADRILEPFFVSLSVLLVTVVVDVAAPIVRRIAFLEPWTELIRGSSYGLISLLTVLEITTILRAMRVTDGLKAVVSQGKTITQIKQRIRQNHEVHEPGRVKKHIDGQEGNEEL